MISRRQFLLALSSLAVSACTTTPSTFFSPTFNKKQPFDDLLSYDALGLANLIKTKQISAEELLNIIIKRIDYANPTLNFITNTAYDRARSSLTNVNNDQLFAGVPILVKDMIDVAGMPRTDGSVLFKDRQITKSVDYILGLEKAGLNIVGMTNVPEMASFIITDNELFGATHNPWNLEYSTFSSSGGSACAIAAGVVPLAHGTDGAGSCRLPPSTTGLLGMKPSRYRMLSGEANGGHDLVKTNQAISRTVRDSAALFSMTENKNDSHFPPIGFVTTSLKRKLKIGVVRNIPNSTPIEPEVNKALESTMALLESLGHELVDVSYPIVFDELMDSYQKFFATKVGPLKTLIEKTSGKSVTESGLLTHLLAQNIEQSSGLSEQEIQQGVDALNTLPAKFSDMFKTCDIVITPVAAFAGTRLDEGSYKDDWNEVTSTFVLERLKYTAPVNFAGNPAMSVPLYWDKNNMPIGSQFIAPLGDDKLLYELAYQLETARPWKDKWAPYSLMYPQNLA